MSSLDDKPFYAGSSFWTLLYIEVLPFAVDDDSQPEITSAFVKHQLLNQSIDSRVLSQDPGLHIQWDSTVERSDVISFGSSCLLKSGLLFSSSKKSCDATPVLHLMQNDPTLTVNLWPCQCRGYAMIPEGFSFDSHSQVIVTESTLIRVLPIRRRFEDTEEIQFTGELPEVQNPFKEDALFTQNPETVQILTMKIRQILLQMFTIGTTDDAFNLLETRKRQLHYIKKYSSSYMKNRLKVSVPGRSRENHGNATQSDSFFRESAVLVHSPHHCGKTTIVHALASKYCDVVHLIRPCFLLAKYGIYTDAALETIVHEIIMAAAVNKKSIAIILDNIDSILPPKLSGLPNDLGDSANPILTACAAYLRNFTSRLQNDGKILFPSKNPLYNVGGKEGVVLKVKVCLIGIVTCPDDGFRSKILRLNNTGTSENISTIFNSLIMGRYRLPDLTAATRIACFKQAFTLEDLQLEPKLEIQYPIIAAAATWAMGPVFRSIASLVKSRTESNIATLSIFNEIIISFSKMHRIGSDIHFLATTENNTKETLFDSVGGNNEAKMALENALGVHPSHRKLLSSLGISPPTGIILIGPPGTGKTLLAKSVARLLHSTNATGLSVGGAFISVKSTDVAQSEVGTGEKMLVAAFDNAKRNAPSVVFIDEFQALFTDRSNGGTGRLSTTLFQCMDNLKKWQGHRTYEKSENESLAYSVNRVLVLAATNTPWMIDKAFLRPGRFDRAILVGLPDALDRRSIFRVHIEQMAIEYKGENSKITGLCQKLSELSPGFSGADIAHICRTAAVLCIMDKSDGLNEHHFFEAMRMSQGPSCSEKLLRELNRWLP